MPTRVAVPVLKGWPLGQQASLPVMAMPEGSLILCRNAEIGADGELTNRKPPKTVSDRVTTNTGAAIAVGGLAEYQTSSVREIIIAGDVAWHKWDATADSKTITAISDGTGAHTANTRWSLVRWRDETRDWLIGANGTNAVRYYDGSTTQTLGIAYVLKYVVVWKDHLWGVESNSNILRFSAFRNPTSFLSTRYDVLLDSAGGSILGIGTTENSLVYLSRRHTNVLQGGSWTNFTTVARYEGVGTVHHKSIQRTPFGLIWLDDDGFQLWNETGPPQGISDGNWRLFRSLDFSQISYCASAFYKNPLTGMKKYICVFTMDGQARNTYAMEFTPKTGGWAVRTGEQIYEAIAGHDSNDLDLLYTMGAAAVLQLHDQKTGDAEPVDFMMITPAETAGRPDVVRTLERITVYYQAATPAVLRYRVTADIHGDTYPASGVNTVTLTADTTIPAQYDLDIIPNKTHFLEGASIREFSIQPDDLRGFTHQLQIHNVQAGQTFRVRGVVWKFQQEDVE